MLMWRENAYKGIGERGAVVGMEGLAMLKQLIGEVQQLLQDGHGHGHHQHHHRWCFFDLDENSVEDNYGCLVMKARTCGTFNILEPIKAPPAKKPRTEQNGGRLPDATSSNENMEQQIWKNFPEDLFEAVIARLPVAAIFRFRSVCRKWNSLLTSQSFSQICAQVPQTQPWFYVMTRENTNTGAVYDPSLKKWHHPTMPTLPKKSIVFPVASAGGLVCFADIRDQSFFVCNPLTQSFKELPARSVRGWFPVAIGMTLNGELTSGGYKILWVDCNGEYEVYDSIENSWTCPGSMPSAVKLPLLLNLRSRAVSIGHTIYFMRLDPDGIVSYNTATGVWMQFVVPAPVHLRDRALVERNGQIMLVGLLTRNAATCVCVWELQKMTLLWKEVDRMPNIWCLEFYGKHIRMTCVGNKGLLMLSLRSRQVNQLVTYDPLSREWLKVPGCMLPCGKKRLYTTYGTAFHPCPTASA